MATNSPQQPLSQQVETNLHVALLAIGNILKLDGMSDSVVEHLMDRMRGMLGPEQRDPLSVFSPQLLGAMTGYVKETFGVDRPVNIHAAPQSRTGKEAEAPTETNSAFALNGMGQNRFEKLTGGTSGSYARLVENAGSSSAAYAALTMQWNPATGAAGLNEMNFARTDFARYGLDLPTAKLLLNEGFTKPQIVTAAQDTKALGFSPKDQGMVKNFAVMNDADPEGRPQRNAAFSKHKEWRERNDAKVERLQEAVTSTEPGTPEHKAALDEYRKTIIDSRKQNGITEAVESLCTPTPGRTPEQTEAACTAAQETVNTIEGVAKQKQLQVELGIDEARVAPTADTGAPGAREGTNEMAAADDFFAAADAQETPAQPSAAAPDSPSTPEAPTTEAAAPAEKAPEQQIAAVEPPAEPASPNPPPAKPARPPVPGGIGHA